MQSMIAESVHIQGDQLVFLDSKCMTAAMFVLTVVESWSESDL
jgi:hypothetical protein